MTIGFLSHRVFSSLLVASILTFSGCTKQGGGSSASGGSGSESSKPGSESVSTACGVVVHGALENPAVLADGNFVSVSQVLSNNLLTVTTDKGATATIKLQGVSSALTSADNTTSINFIRQLTAGGAYFFKATDDCLISTGSGSGTIGTLITKSGQSVNEELIKGSVSPVDKNDACKGDLLGSCYEALVPETNPDDTSSGVGCGFLWKPTSDKDGRLVVLVDECDVRVVVNGEELEQAGAGNGRCTTVRGSKSGCAYGQANVQIFDLFTGLPYVFKGGKTVLTLNGCTRFELPCS